MAEDESVNFNEGAPDTDDGVLGCRHRAINQKFDTVVLALSSAPAGNFGHDPQDKECVIALIELLRFASLNLNSIAESLHVIATKNSGSC